VPGLPELPDVTQRFIADVIPYLEAMDQLIAATEEATAAVEALQRAINGLDGKTVLINVKTVGGGTAGDVANQVAQVKDLAVAWTEDAAAQNAADAAAAAFGRDVVRTATGVEDLKIRIEDAIAAQNQYDDGVLKAAIANAEFDRSLIESERNGAAYTDLLVRRLGPGFLATQKNVSQLAAATDNANRAWAIQIGWFRLTATALHWIVAGSAEFLAVAVPAAVALGAGLAVAAQGAQNAYTHFSALYDATESTYSAFHQTVGTTLGLGDALQKAQNAANPGVYEILGSVVNDAKGSFQSLAGVGLQVVHMFDEFAARVTVDLKQGMGTQIQGLLSGMVTDLQRFGNVLGNLGHALLNFAAAMPGLAHALLDVAVGISDVVEWASRGGALLTFGMALEETFRWGGLLLTMLVRLTGQMALMNSMGATNFITRFGAAVLTLSSGLARGLTALGSFISGLSILPGLTSRVGSGLQTMGASLDEATMAMSPGMVAGAVAAVAALAFLAVAVSRVKDGMQNLAANAVKAVQSAGDLQVFGVAAAQLQRLNAAAQQTSASLGHVSATGKVLAASVGNTSASFVPLLSGFAGLGKLSAGLSTEIGGVGIGLQRAAVSGSGLAGVVAHLWSEFSGATTAASDLSALHQAMATIEATVGTVAGNIRLLSGTFHTSALGALELANAAGVNLQVGLTKGSEAMKIAVQQIDNLKAGLGAMSAPAGVVSADMEAVGVQSALASSKVQTVNSALDAFIAGTTGGMNSVMQFNAALRTMGKDTVAGSTDINGAITSISRTAARMGYTLQGFGAHAQQSWQQFDAAVVQGNSVLDTFRTGMAEGVVSSQQYNNEIRAVGGSLLPFAAHNRAALAIVSQLAQEMGKPATTSLRTLAADFGITGKAAQNMATMGMERLVARMANLNTIARNLSVTIGTQLDSAMSQAIVKASGMQNAYNKWATDAKNGAPEATLKKDLGGVANAEDIINRLTQAGTKLLNDNKTAFTGLDGAVKGATGSQSNYATSAKQTSNSLLLTQNSAKTAALSTQNLGQQTSTATGLARGFATTVSATTTQVHALGSASNTTRASLGTVNNEIRTASSAASGAAGPLNSMAGNIRNVGNAAGVAAGQVRGLEAAIASLQSKTITITTNMVTNTIHRAGGGPVAAGIPYTVGEFGRELFVPGTAGYIVPHDQTQRMLSPVASPATTAQLGGGGGAGGSAVIHNHVYLDGQQIWQNQQQATLIYNVRNGNRGAGVVSPVSSARG
jgi:hypothetical protein